MSRGTGDDAGHLIGHQFGGPETPANLSLQHHAQNQGGGTYYNLEQRWADKVLSGTDVEVEIRETNRAGDDRPIHRHVEWTETTGQAVEYGELDFMNPESERVRAVKGIVLPTYPDSAIVDLVPAIEARQALEAVNAKELHIWNLVGMSEVGKQIGNEAIQLDMELARERLTTGSKASTVATEIGNVRGGSPAAALYGHDVVTSVERQIGPELAKVLGREVER